MKTSGKIVIIGGGLSGVYLAYLLKGKNIDFYLLEGAARIGGRIQTVHGSQNTPLELGATWFSDVHENLLSLIEELGLEKYPQFAHGISLFQTKSFEPPQQFFVPESESSSYRIVGGTSQLIETLSKRIDAEQIKFNSRVVAISASEEGLKVKTFSGEEYNATNVIICMPPQLAVSTLAISPPLANEVSKLLGSVQTWMAGSVKFTLEFESPFWRKKGYSGMLYSHTGIITEMYDHTNFEENKFGFTGFLNGNAASYPQEVRKEYVLLQLVELLGSGAANPLSYYDKVWNDEFISGGVQTIQRPHQNNGHPLLQQSYMESRLFFCGTETSPIHGGYMEGAIIAAKRAFRNIMDDFI